MIQIRRISLDDPLYQQECELRELALLEPVGLNMDRFRAEFPGVEERAEHFVAVLDHPRGPRVVGCALLIPDEPEPRVGKVMQMAVDPQRQNEGIGRRLLVSIESRAFGQLHLRALVCHARDSAIGFYTKLGWAIDSDVFTEVGIPHRRMVFSPAADPKPL